VDVHGSSHGGTQIGWARSDVTEMLVVREFGNLFNFGESFVKSIKNLSDVGSWLHRDNSELILLVNPGKESLGIVVVDTSVLWPVPV
jgi:hypothetical protein